MGEGGIDRIFFKMHRRVMRITPPRVALLVGVLAIVALPSNPALAAESALALSTEALAECHHGRVAQVRKVRQVHFERGVALAERAVALDDSWADGHFALFCNLGERMRLDGEFLASLFGLNRVLTELDRTLELNPDHLEALSCKGTFLVRLPRLFGGDQDRGEHLLRQVIQRAPDSTVNARLVLARSYADRGSHEQAVALAREALRIAYLQNRKDLIPEAKETLAELSPEDDALLSRHSLVARP